MTSGRTIAMATLTVLCAAALLYPASAAAQKSTPANPPELRWTGLEKAIATAAEQKKAVLLDVYTDWCGWCKKMDKEVFPDPAVAEVLAKRFALAKVNGESREPITYKGQKTDGVGIARAFGVRGYPAIIFLDSNGEMLTMIPGFLTAEQFLPVVLFIGNKEYEKMEWDAYLASFNASKKTPAGSK
jgi:thioredoxin-related protein